MPMQRCLYTPLFTGAPVSGVSALPEVAGEAALYIPPHDWQAMAYAIYRVIQDRDLREKLKRLGKLRGDLYSWQRVAEETLGIYSSARSLIVG